MAGKTFRAQKERPGTRPGSSRQLLKLSDGDGGGDDDDGGLRHLQEPLNQPERRTQ
jgi:hypothetical protein